MCIGYLDLTVNILNFSVYFTDIYRCTQCDVCFSYVDYLIRHAKNNHKTVMTAADLPNKTLHYSSQYLASQGLNSQPGNKAEIDQTNKENIGTHQQTVEPKQATNGKIDNWNVSTEFRKNGAVKINEKSLECTEEKIISMKHDMNGNWKVAHQGKHTGDKRYRCDVCGYSTNHSTTLRRHQMRHTGDKPYKCGECGFSTSRMDILQKHQRIHSMGDKSYKCDECGYRTNLKCDLNRHQMRHTGEKPHKCDVCGYSTIHISHLKVHKRIHTGDRPYRCDECGYCTADSSTLIKHQRTHTGEKPYKCDECGYCAKEMGHLKRHQRIHTGEKPFK